MGLLWLIVSREHSMHYTHYIPTAVTLLAGLCTGWALYEVLHQHFVLSVGILLLAFFLDMADGVLARLLNAETNVGRYLDSFVDAFLYILFPIFWYGLQYQFIALWFIPIFFCAGMYRLFRFSKNGFTKKNDTLGYVGVPVYMVLPILVASLLFKELFQQLPPTLLINSIFVIFSIYMVSHVNFPKPTNLIILGTIGVLVNMLAGILIFLWR